MPKLRNRPPTYRLHRASGQACVELNGKTHYLGKHGTPASHQAYDRLIAEWLVSGRNLIGDADLTSALTINQLFVAYWDFVQGYYQMDGVQTGEVQAIRYSLQPVINLYGDSLASQFGPLQLKAARDTMVDKGFVRRLINHRVNRIRRMFRWGVENALVSATVLHGLQAVSPLKAGRTAAPESDPVRPVPEETLRKTQAKLASELRAMTELQWLTGMRPGEVTRLRTCDIDRTGEVWVYRPPHHKTQHHGITREIRFGPKSQAILAAWLSERKPEAYLFSPKHRMLAWNRQRRDGRNTPMTPSQAARAPKRNPKKRHGHFYTTSSYAHAIAAACKQAGVERWGPNRLRHSAATRIRRDYGLDAARVILGHSTPVITEVYAELDTEKATKIAREIM